MEKVIFTDPDTKEKIEFYVLEETQINGKKFLFVTEEEDGDSEAYILKEVSTKDEEVLYQMVEDDVRNFFGKKVYQTVIPRNVRISEAPSHGKPVLIYDFKCPGSQAYISLAGEVLKREKELLAC